MSADGGGSSFVVCVYRVRHGESASFERFLSRHTPTLRRLGLITDHPAQVLRQRGGGRPSYLEVFEWASEESAARASQVPEVIAIWEPMAALCEAREGRPGLEFTTFDQIVAS